VVRPTAVIAPRKFLWLAYLIKAFRRIPLKLAAAGPQRTIHLKNDPEWKAGTDAALITFTTGTTGLPKAAVRTHAILNAQFKALARLLQYHDSVSLTLLPVVVLLNIGLGKTTVLSSVNPKNWKESDAAKLLQLIRRAGVTSIIASPFIVLQLARFCKRHAFDAGITEIVTGGGPVFPEEAALLSEAFPRAATTIVYGSTEAEPISHIRAPELIAAKDTVAAAGLPVGRIDANALVTVVPCRAGAYLPVTSAQWQQLQVPPGTVGEIVVSGAHVVRHYVANKEEERQQKIYVEETVWHRTGDAGRLDERGNLCLYGRCSQVVQHNGKTIYPFLTEHAVKQVAGVKDAALFKKGETPILAVVLAAGASQSLKNWLNQNGLEGIALYTVNELPKDARHRTKIDYKKLQAMTLSPACNTKHGALRKLCLLLFTFLFLFVLPWSG
jgi:acyl-CoA synthetase (AMP-forming)/AMP-acid ligase II